MTNQETKRILFADMALLLVAIIWGGGFIAAKIALYSVTPLYLLSFRFIFSGLILGILFFHKVRKIDRKSLRSGMLLGVLLYIGQTLQTIGLNHTTAAKQSFLVATYTIMVPFLSWILNKKKPHVSSVLAGVLTCIGIGLLSLQRDLTMGFGDSLTLGFAALFALQIVLIGIYAKHIDPVHLTMIQLLTAGILSAMSALVFEPRLSTIDNRALLSIGYLVIFNTAMAFLVQNIAQRYTSDTHASIIISLEALFGSVLAVLLLGEVFTGKMMIGATFILMAVMISKVLGKKPEREQGELIIFEKKSGE